MAEKFHSPIHAFRGFAIINIVAIHAFAFILVYARLGNPEATANWSELMVVAHSVLDMANGILLHDSTLYFTIISGMLFSMVLSEKGYRRFFSSKILYVLLPYLFFTILYSSYDRTFPPGTPHTLFSGTPPEFVEKLLENLVQGTALRIFWYIPVLAVLYLLTPLLNKLLESQRLRIVVWLIVLAPLLVSRTATTASLPTLVYFGGAYLVGMTAGRYYDATIRIVRENIRLMVIVSVITTLQIAATGHFQTPNYGVLIVAESAWYLQKLAFAGLALYFFDKTIEVVPKWLDFLANYAFAVYFIHMGLIIELVWWMGRNDVVVDTVGRLIFYMAASIMIALGGSALIAWSGKRMLGRRSRLVLGA